MKLFPLVCSFALLVVCLQACCAKAAKPKLLLSPVHHRIVFLGDSITDGNTYPAWIKQALVAAGYAAPICINAGYGGHTSTDMLQRLDRDVIAFHPTLVCISAGVNDQLRGGDFYHSYPAIVERLEKEKIPMLLLTLSVLGTMNKNHAETSPDFNAFIRKLGQEHHIPVAEVDKLHLDAWANGIEVLTADHVHPNFAGQRLMAQAVLQAMGYPNVTVPATFVSEVIPGLVKTWKMRAVTEANAAPLDEHSVLAVKPDATWKSITFPETTPAKGEWENAERQCGFAWSLPQTLGTGRYYLGCAVIREKAKKRHAYINLGGYVRSIWLNGKHIYTMDPAIVWPGWHMGKLRFPIDLHRGNNTLIIETYNIFAVSITNGTDW